MFKIKVLVLLISLLSILQAVKSEEPKKFKFLSCNATNATAEATGCPKGSNCIENGTVNGTLNGFCVCGFNLTVNEKYLATDNKTQYCIAKESETHPTESPPTKATNVPTTSPSTSKPATTPKAKVDPTESPTTKTPTSSTTTTKTPEIDDKSDVKKLPAPESHHLVGGILLPLVIVLAFIGTVFAVRKYDLIERAHGYIRGRNQATRYNGLMENDFDDDPLLI